MQKICKFYGSYRDLKYLGFKFQKLYARNYRQWAYEVDPNTAIRVWHKGSEVTIADFHGYTQDIIDALTKPEMRNDYKGRCRFVIDRKTESVVKYVDEIHNEFRQPWMTLELCCTPEAVEWYNRYRIIIISTKLELMIQKMFELGMIKESESS